MYRILTLIFFKNFRRHIILKFCKNLLFISIEDHIIMHTKEKKFFFILKLHSVKYLQHIYLIEINDVNIRQLQNSLAGYSRYQEKFFTFVNSFKTQERLNQNSGQSTKILLPAKKMPGNYHFYQSKLILHLK